MNRHHKIPFGILALLLVLGAGPLAAAPRDAELGDGLFARIVTTRGDIVLRLEYEKVPLTVCNFVALAEGTMSAAGGKPFYDGLSFHRVIPNFMIQGGDPLGNGTGGPGYRFSDEFDATLKHDRPGILSMANAGPGTNGSQFFITHKATPWLDGKHSVFGGVVDGQTVVDAIRQGDLIRQVSIVRNGSGAKGFKADQAAFDSLARDIASAAGRKGKQKQESDLALIAGKYPGLSRTASGIQYRILKEGTGTKPPAGKTVALKYRGLFLDGKVFDASDMHGGAFEFQVGLGRVITGWEEMVLDMRLGEKRLAVIPPELAYGEQGAGGVIPGNTFLVFEMELLKIK